MPEGGEAQHIFTGAPVIIRGLQGAAEYNGRKGKVSGGPWENGRYEVAVQPQEGSQQQGEEAKTLALKPANFQLDTEALKEYLVQKRADAARRSPPLEDLALVWTKGKGLSGKALTWKTAVVGDLEEGHVLLRIDKFAFSQMALGYLMKGFTRTFGAYHSFYEFPEEGFYRSACWGYATVVESAHPKVAVGTRLYGLVPPCRYKLQRVGGTIPAGKNGEPAKVELAMDGVPYNMRRFQELDVVESAANSDPVLDEWKIITKEIYTMAFYMDENLLVTTGMINSVIISCASSKTGLALAYCLRMREMRYVVGLTSKEHLEFVKSTELYHDVFTYDEVDSLPNDRTNVYMDFKCDGDVRQRITLRMGTNLMFNMVIGPPVFQRRMKDQVFEKKARETLFDESSWRERRRMVAEVTKTGRNEKLRYSQKAFIERMRKYIKVKHLGSAEAFKQVYDDVYSNTVPPDEAYVCTLHEGEFEGEALWEG